MAYKTEIKCYLTIFGEEFDSKKFSESIKLDQSTFWIKGDKSKNTKFIRKQSGWKYSTPYIETLYIEEVFGLILTKFSSKKEIIKKAINEHNAKVKLYIVLEIFDGNTPAVYFDREFLSFINEIEAEIDFDIYASQNDEEEAKSSNNYEGEE